MIAKSVLHNATRGLFGGPSPSWRVVAFDLLGIGASFGTLLGTDAISGGYIAGGILTIGLFLVMAILMSKMDTDSSAGPMSFTIAVGLILSTLFGWWPVWAVLVAVIFILFGISGILHSASD